jgi:type VI secretion system protein
VTLFAEIAGTTTQAATLRHAVISDLARICSIRRGSLLLAPDYGVDEPTFLFFAFPSIDGWTAHLARSLARYEPRLRSVRVVPLVSDALDLTLRAEIQGVLVAGDGSAEARFTARLDSQCRLSVT